MENSHNRNQTFYGKMYGDRDVPSYPPEVLTPEQIAYDRRVEATQEMGIAMARNAEGLRLMREARERNELENSGAA